MPTAKEFRKRAWATFRKSDTYGSRWGGAILAFIIVGILNSVLSGFIVGILAALPLTMGLYAMYLNMYKDNEWSVGDIFSSFRNGMDYYLNSFLLLFVNSIFIFLWSLLFVIPGIIKTFSYSMSPYILIDNPVMTAGEARRKSIEIMKGNKWKLFCLQFSFIGWILLSILTFGILFLWVIPAMEMSKIAFYKEISGHTVFEAHEEKAA